MTTINSWCGLSEECNDDPDEPCDVHKLVAERDAAVARAEAAEAKVERLRLDAETAWSEVSAQREAREAAEAKVAAVEALLDDPGSLYVLTTWDGVERQVVAIGSIRAALATEATP